MIYLIALLVLCATAFVVMLVLQLMPSDSAVIRRLGDIAAAALFLQQLDEVAQVDVGGGHLLAKDARERLGIRSRLGNVPLLCALEHVR